MAAPGFNTAADLRTCRTNARLTQARLAELAGFHEQAVRYWEGKRAGRIDGVAPAAFRRVLVGMGISVPARGEAPALLLQPNIITAENCGARTRAGGKCQCKPVPGGRRCRLHGGLSTGPRTVEGRNRIREAMKARRARELAEISA